MGALWPLERFLLAQGLPPAPPPVFVLGAPRSGTTLLFQVLTHALRFAYISNLAHRLYRTPVAATRIGRRVIREFRCDFTSRYGHTEGWGAPNEGGWVWNRWCAPFNYQDEHALSVRAQHEMHRTIAAISRVVGAPFISKNTVHSVQVRLLNRVFPGCVFLMLLRPPHYTIQSLMRAREERKERENVPLEQWMGVQPRALVALCDRDYVAQICGQVYHVEREAYDDLLAVSPDRTLAIDYDVLCADPTRIVAAIRTFLGARGIVLAPRLQPPPPFPPSRRLTLPAVLRARVDAEVAELWGRYDPWRHDARLPCITLEEPATAQR